jgi:hypothetical protein
MCRKMKEGMAVQNLNHGLFRFAKGVCGIRHAGPGSYPDRETLIQGRVSAISP